MIKLINFDFFGKECGRGTPYNRIVLERIRNKTQILIREDLNLIDWAVHPLP